MKIKFRVCLRCDSVDVNGKLAKPVMNSECAGCKRLLYEVEVEFEPKEYA